MLKQSIIFIVILTLFIITGGGEDQLYAPARGSLKIAELQSSMTELESGDTATIE